MEVKYSKGPAAALCTLFDKKGKSVLSEVTFDWAFDAVYYRYGGNMCIISVGPKTSKYDVAKIDTDDKKSMFKRLAFRILNDLQNSTLNPSKEQVKRFTELVDLFV